MTNVAKTKHTKTKKSTKESKFAEGICFKKLFFVFLICSVAGSFYEQFLYAGETFLRTGQAEWSLRRGVIYGPFNVIYGFGAVIAILLLARKELPSWKVFLYSALLGGVVEYLISFLQEFFTHTRSWDYSQELLDINGRTTLPFMLVWGFLGWLLVKVVYPWLSRWVESIPQRIGNYLFVILLVFMVFDMFISWTAILRQTLRHNNVPAYTPIGRFYDWHYNDEYLEIYFPNMSHPDQER